MRRSAYPEKGLWHATYGPYEPSPPLEGDVAADVAIVGGGFTGLSAAYPAPFPVGVIASPSGVCIVIAVP